MNSNVHSTLALRYAKAFLHAFTSDIDQNMIANVNQCADFLDKHHSWLFLSNLSLIPNASKERMIFDICTRYNLSESYSKLFSLVIEHQRMALMPSILRTIIKEYMHKAHVYAFQIESSCQLTTAQEQELQMYLEKKIQESGKNAPVVRCTYRINPQLIAGICIKSDTLLWENSVKKYLTNINNSLRC